MNLVVQRLMIEIGDQRAGKGNMSPHRRNNERLMIMNTGRKRIFLRNLISADRLENQIAHLGFFVAGQQQRSKLGIQFQEAVPVAVGFVAAAVLISAARGIAQSSSDRYAAVDDL